MRYMHEYGATSTDLAQVCDLDSESTPSTTRTPSSTSQPLTLEDHQNSRMIVDPLRLYDCCQETDGGCACIVTTPERARDLRQPGALIRGVAQASGAIRR